MGITLHNARVPVATFLILMLLHAVVSSKWDRQDPVAASQWGLNKIKSERFLFNNHQQDCILVGTSMSAGVGLILGSGKNGKPRIVNLAYAGGSAQTGMSLLHKSGAFPRCVLVEVNLAYKVADDEHIAEMTQPFWRKLKTLLPGFRHENQPMNLLLTFIMSVKQQFSENSSSRATVDDSALPAKSRQVQPDSGASDQLIDNRLKGLRNITQEQLRDGAKLMLDMAADLEAQGTRVVFFEMPGEARVRDSEYYEVLRNQFASIDDIDITNDSFFKVLHRINIGDAHTVDGIHLTKNGLNLVVPELFSLIEFVDS